MAAKIAKAMGAKVTIFTASEDKIEYAKRLDINCVLENDEEQLKSLKSSFDFILSTIPERHDVNPFINLLKRATITVVGALEPITPVNNQMLAFQRKQVAGSLIGSLADTQEILDFCAEHKIGPDVEIINIQNINEAYQKVTNGEVRFRYVIDMASLQHKKNKPATKPIQS